MNSTFKSWKCCFYAEFEGGLYFNTRLNWKRAFRSKTACRGFKSFCPCQNKKTPAGVFFCFVVKAEGLEPRNSKVRALLTVNSPVDCLRIELIIKPLPKKAPIFRCFFPLFTPFYGDFACFSHIDKITAHGFFRTPLFHFRTVFCSLCATQSTQSFWYIIKKASITIQIRLQYLTILNLSCILLTCSFFVRIDICRFNTVR